MTEQDPIANAARQRLGYQSLRPGQREAIQSVLDGHDTLAVLATGVGKSAIYELAGPLLGGSSVVVSPLIALQRDQLAGLNAAGPDPESFRSGAADEELDPGDSGSMGSIFCAPVHRRS